MKRIATISIALFIGFIINAQPVMEFDGVDDYKAVPEFYYNSTGIQEATVEAWIKTNSDGFIASWDRSEYWRLEIVSGKIRWDVRIGGSIVDFSGNTTVADGNWHHVAGVVDNGTLLIYVDGNLDNSTSPGGNMGTGTTRYGFIGTGSEASSYDGSHSGTEFKGQIDELRVWTVALDQTTLNEWKGQALTTSHPDFSNLAYASTSMDFDGNNDYIDAGDVNFMDAAAAFTVEMWFKRHTDRYSSDNSNHDIGNVLMAQSSSSDNDNFEIGTNGSNIEIYIDSETGQDGKESYNAGIQNGTWHHLALTYDANEGNEAKIYIDGGLVAEENDWSSQLDASGSSPLTFGIARGGSTNWGDFDGQIDEIRIFDVALEQATIQEFMYNGINTHPNLADLQIYYPIYVSGSSSTSVLDADGDDATINGTMVGMNATVDRVMEVTLAVPTLSQWGIIILSLLTLSLMTLLMKNKHLISSGQAANYSSILYVFKYTFDLKKYTQILSLLILVTVAGFGIIHFLLGSNGILDFTGTLISTAIVAYMLHLEYQPEKRNAYLRNIF